MSAPAQSSATYFLYILRCSDGSLYTGISVDPEQRLRAHADRRRGAKYLRGRLPAALVFQQPAGDRSEAQRLEACVKRLSRADKLRLIDGDLHVSGLPGSQTSGSSPG